MIGRRGLVPVGLLLMAAAPNALRAQTAGFEARLDARTLAIVRPILEQAARDSLPVEALRAKVLEGVTKGVEAERIGPVVADLADELRTVRAGLSRHVPGARPGGGELLAAALAVRQGVSLEVLGSVWQSRQDGEPLDVPVTVLGELVRRGVPVGEAAEVMSHVVRARVPLHVAAQIPGKLDGARRPGEPPGRALGEALRALNIPDPPRGRGRRPNG